MCAVSSPCIPARRALNNNGYGEHRKVYEEAKGPIPPRHDVAHLCHNRACVNPAHLVAVTRKENEAMKPPGRHAGPKMRPAQVRAIRDLARLGWKQLEIAQAVGTTGSSVAKVLLGMYYRDV